MDQSQIGVFKHCFLTDGSVGKQCILIPGVSPLFVQDFWFGPPATQNTLQRLVLALFAFGISIANSVILHNK